MDIKYLDNFLALVQYQSFSEAADACYISQSSFSKRISRLENELGVSLFERSTHQVKLTDYGEIYLKYARQIKQLSEQANDEIKRRKDNDAELIIGGIPSISEYGILDLIAGFIKETHIHCQIKSAPSEKLELMLTNHTVDFAFIKNVHPNDAFIQQSYTQDHLVAVLPPNHPLAKAKSIQIKQLAHDDFIFQPVNSRPYELCVDLCKSNGFTPNIIYADRIVENILNFVKKGLGVSLLMNKLVTDTAGLAVIPIEPKTIANISLCYENGRKLTAVQKKFIDYCHSRNV